MDRNYNKCNISSQTKVARPKYSVEKLLPVAIEITLGHKLDQQTLANLNQQQKVTITKLTRNLNLLCKMNKK